MMTNGWQSSDCHPFIYREGRKIIIMLKAYSKLMDIIFLIVKWVVIAASILMVLCMAYQVFTRYFLHMANAWSEELTRLMCIWTVVLGSAIAIREKGHLQIDVLTNLIHGKTHNLLEAIIEIVVLIFIAIMIKYSVELCQSVGTASSAGLRISKVYVYMCMPVGFTCMLLSTIEVLLKDIASFLKKEA